MYLIRKIIRANLTLFLTILFSHQASAAWVICLEGPYGGMSNNARVLRSMTATEQTNFGYHDYHVLGVLINPYQWTSYEEDEIYQPQLMDLDLTYTVYWITNVPINTTTEGQLYNIDTSVYPYQHLGNSSYECAQNTVWIIP